MCVRDCVKRKQKGESPYRNAVINHTLLDLQVFIWLQLRSNDNETSLHSNIKFFVRSPESSVS